jgi:hypothetical protein
MIGGLRWENYACVSAVWEDPTTDSINAEPRGWLKSITILWYSRNNFIMGRFLNKCSKEKKWRCIRILHDPPYDLLEETFPNFKWVWDLMWRVISSAHNFAVVQTVRKKLHITLNNICTVLTLTGIELGTPKSLNIKSVMSTFPLYQRGALQNNV